MKRQCACLILCLSLVVSCQPAEKTQKKAIKPANELSQTTDSATSGDALNNDANNERPTLIGPASSEEKLEINRRFKAFKNAVLNYKGTEAASFLSQESLEYYQNLMGLAHALLIDADNYEALSKQLSPSVRTNVALMASRIGAELLKEASPEEIYALAFKEGWIGYNSFLTASIDKIDQYKQGNDTLIIADFYYEGVLKDKQVPRIAFRFQDGEWRIDLTPLFVAIDMAVKKYVKDEQIDLESSIDLTISESNNALKPSQWKFFKDENHGFAAKFPNQPLYTNNAPYHSFKAETAQNLFGVLHRDYSANKAHNPFKDKELQDYEVQNFFIPLGIADNHCLNVSDKETLRVSCSFSSKTNNIIGKVDFYFLNTNVYIVYAIAQNPSYRQKLAQSFLESFLVLWSFRPMFGFMCRGKYPPRCYS